MKKQRLFLKMTTILGCMVFSLFLVGCENKTEYYAYMKDLYIKEHKAKSIAELRLQSICLKQKEYHVACDKEEFEKRICDSGSLLCP